MAEDQLWKQNQRRNKNEEILNDEVLRMKQKLKGKEETTKPMKYLYFLSRGSVRNENIVSSVTTEQKCL